ncbi:MAG: collagen binding domain-containing protein [Clostridiaceae bacterium]
MQLPGQIKIATAIDMLMTNPADGETVAYIHIDTNGKVKITFTAYPSQDSDVYGGFTLDCHFNESQIGNVNLVTIYFTVPGTGVVHVGPFNFQQPDTTITKSGAYNSTTDEITWTITVNKEAVGLDNASVVDTINSGQVLVDNSVEINSTPAVLGTNYSYDNASRNLTVNLSRITSQQVITYKTSVHNDLASKSQGAYNYTNTAALNCDINGTPKNFTSNTVTIPVTVKYISKTGTLTYTFPTGSGNTVVNKTPTYTYGNSYIDWTLNINSKFNIDMNEETITDTLQEGLSLNTDTVELYEATVNSDGTLTAGAKVTLTAENVKYDPDTRKLFKYC